MEYENVNGLKYEPHPNDVRLPHSKNTFFFVKETSWLMLYGEIIHIYSQDQTKHMDKLHGQNIEFMKVKQLLHKLTPFLSV
jgi:hypothetical protein